MMHLELRHRLRGTWHRVEEPGVERPFEFVVRVAFDRLSDVLGHATARLEGHLVALGLTGGAACKGTLVLGSLVREGSIEWSLHFYGDDGVSYRFDGRSEVDLLALPRALTVLPGYVFDQEGREVGRVVLRYDWRGELGHTLRSARVAGPLRSWLERRRRR